MAENLSRSCPQRAQVWHALSMFDYVNGLLNDASAAPDYPCSIGTWVTPNPAA